jgi:TetR/AcrR family transcriptional regulator, tetracycline repressor protein
MTVSPEEEKQRGLTRERLVDAALALINDDGLDGLSMRALADRLDVKAASLYWHVRDRRELLDLLAEGLLEDVPRARRQGDWRRGVLATGEALRRTVSKHKDADRVLLEAPGAFERSHTFADLKTHLEGAGLQASEASDVAMMAMSYVIAGGAGSDAEPVVVAGGEPATLAIDSGSHGVVVRAGKPDMQGLFRVPPDQDAAAPAVAKGETVVVRRTRGVGLGQIELNPRRPWRFKVQAPTWRTVLEVGDLDVRGIHIDSGASKVECFLPPPRGVVPIRVSGGVVDVALHRPQGVAVVAVVHTGAVKLKLDEFSTRVAVFDVHWQTEGASASRDRYELDVSSGAVKFSLDTYEAKVARAAEAATAESKPAGKVASALDILLDGVEARTRR